MNNNRLLLGLFGAILMVTSCGNKQKSDISLRLTPAERTRIDTLYTVKLDSLRPIWDQLCIDGHDKDLRKAVDSIVSERLRDEQSLRDRYSQ